MPFIIKTNKGYIKRTSNFGAFHGSIIVTQDRGEAYRFTRKSDAEKRADTAQWRTRQPDDRGQWDSRGGYPDDIKKFGGTLTCEVLEVE